MQRKSSITLLGITFLLLGALALAAGHWLASPAAAESPSDTTRDLLANQDQFRGKLFAAALFEEDEEEEDFDEDFDEEEDEDFDEDEDEEELELHRRHLELERAELETTFGRLELVNHIAEVAGDELRAAAFAVSHIMEFMEHEEEAIDFLTDMLKETRNSGIRRLIHMKLAEVYAHTDQPELAKDHLRALIVSE